MSQFLAEGTWWEYMGAYDGDPSSGWAHCIIGMYDEGGLQVVTWSQSPEKTRQGGWSWLGSAKEFWEQFDPIISSTD